MSGSSDEETLKRIVFWNHIDRTVRVAVSEYSFHARNFVLPQFKGSDEERAALERAIATLEPAMETIVERLEPLKATRPALYKSAFQELHSLLAAYATIGASHAYTEVVDRAALQPVVEQRSQAGKRAASLRAATMTEPWQKLFDPILVRVRRENPQLRNAGLIREGRRAYGSQGPKLPGDRQLATHVNDMIGRGELSPGPSDGRGRRIMKST